MVVEVELGPLGEAKGRVARVAACDGCQSRRTESQSRLKPKLRIEWKLSGADGCTLEARGYLLLHSVCVLSFN